MTTQKAWRRRTRNQILFLCFTVGLLILGFSYFAAVSRSENTITAYFKSGTAQSQKYVLEIAKNEAEREKGLMFRRAMPSDRGMIFIFPESKQQSFWMKNTYLSLDMIFIDESKRVVGVLHSVPPLNTEPRSVPGTSKYVVELVAGEAKKHAIAAGSVFESLSSLPTAK